MTEKDLFKYKDAVLEERRRRQLLIENETRINALRSPVTPTPPSHSGDSAGRVAADLDRLDRCRAKLKEAIEDVALAELVLERARRMLDERERAVFDLLYFGYTVKGGERVFCTIAEAAKRLNYAQSTVYSIRRQILSKIAGVAA